MYVEMQGELEHDCGCGIVTPRVEPESEPAAPAAPPKKTTTSRTAGAATQQQRPTTLDITPKREPLSQKGEDGDPATTTPTPPPPASPLTPPSSPDPLPTPPPTPPSTPEPSSSTESDSEGEKEDVTDGRLSAILLNTVKDVVVYLLEHTLRKYRTEICNGCVVSHPSQRQHPCLEEEPDYFYLTHYERVNERLWTEKLIPAVSNALAERSLHVSDSRIHGLVEAFLYELKFTPKIHEVADKLINGNVGKLKMLLRAFDVWEDKPKGNEGF